MDNNTPAQTTAESAPAQTAPAQTQTAPAAQQPAAAPAQAAPAQAQAAPTAQPTAQPQPQPQAPAAQAPTAQAVPPTPAHWSDYRNDPAVIAVMNHADAFIKAHPEEQNSIALLVVSSTSPAEFENLLKQKETQTMSNTINANASAAPTVNAPVAAVPAAVPVLPALATAERKSFSEWTTTEMVVVGLGAAALVGVTIWAVVATVKANRYKAALADAVSGNSGM